MKKILILGGSNNQLPLILSAKKLGLYIVLCDYAEENEGRKYCDAFYQISTLDKEAVLECAENEKVDGVVTNSEPAVPVCAYVANTLGLPSNPYRSVLTLSRKDLFREFLNKNGFNCPKSFAASNLESALETASIIGYPLMVKPVDSSGSRGVCLIQSKSELPNAFKRAMEYSKIKSVLMEQYIENTNEYLIGGDIFVIEGKVVFWGLLNCIRDKSVDEFIPLGKSSPVKISEHQFEIIKHTINRLINLLDIRFGSFNVEMVFSKGDQLFIIEMNPRNGGNRIPEFLRELTGVDLYEATIQAALGKRELELKCHSILKYMSTYILHSKSSGVLESISFAEVLKRHIVDVTLYKKVGEQVNRFENSSDLIGILFLQFDSEEDMLDKIKHMQEYIQIAVC